MQQPKRQGTTSSSFLILFLIFTLWPGNYPPPPSLNHLHIAEDSATHLNGVRQTNQWDWGPRRVLSLVLAQAAEQTKINGRKKNKANSSRQSMSPQKRYVNRTQKTRSQKASSTVAQDGNDQDCSETERFNCHTLWKQKVNFKNWSETRERAGRVKRLTDTNQNQRHVLGRSAWTHRQGTSWPTHQPQLATILPQHTPIWRHLPSSVDSTTFLSLPKRLMFLVTETSSAANQQQIHAGLPATQPNTEWFHILLPLTIM